MLAKFSEWDASLQIQSRSISGPPENGPTNRKICKFTPA